MTSCKNCRFRDVSLTGNKFLEMQTVRQCKEIQRRMAAWMVLQVL